MIDKSQISSHIQYDKIESLKKDLLQKKKCPYHELVGAMNKFSSYVTSDRPPTIRNIVKQLIDLFSSKKPATQQIQQEYQDIGNGLSMANKCKIYKHLYDVIYIQEEVYPLMHEFLSDDSNSQFQCLADDAQMLDLQDPQTRNLRGMKFSHTTEQSIEAVIHDRERNKIQDPHYRNALHIAMAHTSSGWNEPRSFGMTFVEGFGDGRKNIWNMIEPIPELFEKKYRRRITAKEYRDIALLNIKNMILPLSSINMDNLINLVRPETWPEDEDSVGIVTYNGEMIAINGMHNFNKLEMSVDTFELWENDILAIKPDYISERVRRMDKIVNQATYLLKFHADYYSSGLLMTTGCPALTATTTQGKRVVQQFGEDMIRLLDTIYFPYRDK